MKEFIVCELLGMSANTPTDLCFSFTGLTRRGGETGPHKDGWGMAFYEGKGVRLFHDPEPCATSKIAEFVSHLPIKSRTAICHIRQANVGNINLANTHPFTREMWGKYWVFAHNGQTPHTHLVTRTHDAAFVGSPPTQDGLNKHTHARPSLLQHEAYPADFPARHLRGVWPG